MPTTLQAAMIELQYPTSLKGVCHGSSIMAERARRCGEFLKFFERMKLVTGFDPGVLSAELDAAKRHAKQLKDRAKLNTAITPKQIEAIVEEKLNAREKQLLTVETFFYQIWAHFAPDAMQSFLEMKGPCFNQTDTRKIEELLYGADSGDLKTSPLREPNTYLIFNQARKNFLNLFLTAVINADKETLKDPKSSVGLVICSSGHTVHLFFDEGDWYLTNHSSIKRFTTLDLLLTKLDDIFSNQGNANLSIQVFSDNPPKPLLDELTDIEKQSKESLGQTKMVNIAGKDGATPLLMAARDGRFDVVKTLLGQRRIDIEAKTIDGFTPLFVAAQNGHAPVVEALLQRMAEPNTLVNNATALFIAAQSGHEACVKLLLKYRADPNIPFRATADELKKFATSYAPSIIGAMNAFIDSQTPDADNKLKLTPYDIAKLMGHAHILQYLKPAEEKPGAQPDAARRLGSKK